MAKENILNYETVALDDEKNALVIIDQTFDGRFYCLHEREVIRSAYFRL
jgi:hypothetical protein